MAKDPNYFVWGKAALAALAPGQLVWARFRDYPFWPGVVDVVYPPAAADGAPAFSVLFLGDDTWCVCVFIYGSFKPCCC